MNEKTSKSKINLRIVIPILLVISIVISAASVGIFSLFGNGGDKDTVASNSSPSDISSVTPEPIEKVTLDSFRCISVTPGVDFLIDEATHEEAVDRAMAMIDSIKADGFDSIELTLNYKDGLVFETELYPAPVGALLNEFYTYAKRQGIKVITTLDVLALNESGLNGNENIAKTCTVLSDDDIGSYSDAVLIKNCYLLPEESGEDTKSEEQQLNEAVKALYSAVNKADPTLSVGFEINESEMPEAAVFDPKQWLDGGFADFVIVYDPYSTASDDISFMTYFEGWRTELGDTSKVFCRLAYDKVGSGEEGWEQTDQILLQLTTLKTLGVSGFIIDGWHDFANDKTESRDAVKKYLADLITDSYILRELTISKPEKKIFTTSSNTVLLSGASDPEFKLTLNGKELERTELGYFSTDLSLKDGANTFVIEHKGIQETLTITYKRTIIKEISPTNKQSLPSESILLVSCTALSNSKVLAALGELEVQLTENPILDENGYPTGEYSTYSGRIILPSAPDEDIDMGKISFVAESQYGKETKTGGKIIILKEEEPEDSSSETSTSSSTPSIPSEPSAPSSTVTPSVDVSSSGSSSGTPSSSSSQVSSNGSSSDNSTSSTSSGYAAPSGGDAWQMPSSGKYTSVGSTYIAEIINWQAETFSSTDDSDYSRPTNNYLPEGTVDYCSTGDVYSSGGYMKILRYGNMVYKTSSKGIATLKVYKGTLPDHNTIGVAGVSNTGRHTQITLNTLWKAPFRFDLKPQAYKNENAGSRDYTITSATYSYVDITFCYTTLVAGEVIIPANDPVFKSAEWIKNESDYTLRLHLKNTGKFYGWSAEYNAQGQLVFSFLNPAKITADATNGYGYRLDGIVIAIDVGHGGSDVGAVGSHGSYNESQLNLILAEKLKAELEALGAKVYMTRYDNDSNPSSDERMRLLRDIKADFCIAIHRNASDSSAPRAFNTYHFNAFSADAAKKIYAATEEADLYEVSKWSGVKWHYFYTCRQTDCPVVLTENGFITNADEYSDMIRDDFNSDCAKALAQGIVDYFASVQFAVTQEAV